MIFLMFSSTPFRDSRAFSSSAAMFSTATDMFVWRSRLETPLADDASTTRREPQIEHDMAVCLCRFVREKPENGHVLMYFQL